MVDQHGQRRNNNLALNSARSTRLETSGPSRPVDAADAVRAGIESAFRPSLLWYDAWRGESDCMPCRNDVAIPSTAHGVTVRIDKVVSRNPVPQLVSINGSENKHHRIFWLDLTLNLRLFQAVQSIEFDPHKSLQD